MTRGGSHAKTRGELWRRHVQGPVMGMSRRLCRGRSQRGARTRRHKMTEDGSEGGRGEAKAGTVHCGHDEARLAGLSNGAVHPDFSEAFWLQRDRGWGGCSEQRDEQGRDDGVRGAVVTGRWREPTRWTDWGGGEGRKDISQLFRVQQPSTSQRCSQPRMGEEQAGGTSKSRTRCHLRRTLDIQVELSAGSGM